ncbi:MAG: MATE family efflux transporter, partial [Firmicutes bacterium]|nr:MATE family efflux transporter [Bacillota bacterium]
NKKNLRLHKQTTMDIIKLGLPSGITQAIMAMAMLVVQNLTNKMGELVIACNVIVMRVDGFAMMPNMTFGQAMTVYTGQNVGAGRLDRVNQGIRQGLYMAVGTAVVITILLLIFGRTLFDIFTDTQELIDLAMTMMCILAAGYIAMAVTQVLGGVMRGGGDTMTPMWLSFITTIIIRIPIAYGLAYLTRSEQFPDGSPVALFTSLLIAWCSGAVLHYFFFRRGKWRKTADEAIKRAKAKSA